jgi:hypothetical protein
MYGLNGVIAIVSVLLSLHLSTLIYFYKTSSFQLILESVLILIFFLLVLLKKNKIKFKLVEGIATLNLILFLYSGIFYALSNQ